MTFQSCLFSSALALCALAVPDAAPASVTVIFGSPALDAPATADATFIIADRGRGRGGDDDDSGRGRDDDDDDDHDRGRNDADDNRRDDDGSGSGRSRPRIPGGSGCDDPGDVAEHSECRG